MNERTTQTSPTEDLIADHIDRFVDESDNASEPAGTSTEVSGERVDAGQRDETQLDAIGKGDRQDKTDQQTTAQRGAVPPKDKEPRGPEDIVDAQGNVIAKGGRERRFYEQLQEARTHLQNLATERQRAHAQIQQMQVELDAVRRAGNAGQQAGLSLQETAVAVEFMAKYKSDPVNTVRNLLTHLKSQGYNIDEIASGVDMGAIKRLVTEAIAPFQQDRQREAEVAQQRQQAVAMYQNFLSQYPDAQKHDQELGAVLERQPGLSLEAAYYWLRNFYNERGLSFDRTLAEHDAERAKQQQANPNTQRRAPLPNGRAPTFEQTTSNAGIAPASSSSEDIVREAMREAGINIDRV